MAKLNVVGFDSFEVENGKKLVHALEDNGVDILHRCGGKAKCISCRVEVIEGDFGAITAEEKNAFQFKNLDIGSHRLSCQIVVNGDATVKPIMTVENSNLDPGPRPAE